MKKENNTPANGIYLIFNDGHYEPFHPIYADDEQNTLVHIGGVKYIGIIHDGHAFAVALHDLGEFPLLNKTAKCEPESDFYHESECDALNDWDYVLNTERIKKLGTPIPLQEGEYLPTLPMLVTMCYLADRGLNDALIAVGGEPLKKDFYWSVTEISASNAWGVNFRTGFVTHYNGYNKYYSNVARAMAAFNL